MRGVRPTCGDRVLLPFLARTAALGAGLTLARVAARWAFNGAARGALHAAGAAAEEAVVAATRALVRGLGPLQGGGAPLAPPALAAACSARAAEWALEMTAGGRVGRALQGALGAPRAAWALTYLRVQAALALALGVACIGLFFVHTGKPPVRLVNGSEGVARRRREGEGQGSGGSGAPSPPPALTDAEYEAQRSAREGERAARAAEEELRALSRPNQLRWALAFFALLAATLLSAYGAASMLNAAAQGPSALSRAAQALSLRWPPAPLPPPSARRSGVHVAGASATEDPLELALRWGVWQGGATHGRLPRGCLEAMAGAVEPLVDAPRMAEVALLGSWGGGGGEGWDPLGATWLAGWLSVGGRAGGGALGLVLPTDAVLARGVVVVFSGFMIAVVVLLFGVDSYHSECRPYLLRRRARAQRAAAEARQQREGQRAEAARGGSS